MGKKSAKKKGGKKGEKDTGQADEAKAAAAAAAAALIGKTPGGQLMRIVSITNKIYEIAEVCVSFLAHLGREMTSSFSSNCLLCLTTTTR